MQTLHHEDIHWLDFALSSVPGLASNIVKHDATLAWLMLDRLVPLLFAPRQASFGTMASLDEIILRIFARFAQASAPWVRSLLGQLTAVAEELVMSAKSSSTCVVDGAAQATKLGSLLSDLTQVSTLVLQVLHENLALVRSFVRRAGRALLLLG